MFGLVYGVVFIQGACKFYDLDQWEPEMREEEYDEKFDQVIFLEENSNI